MAPKSIKDVKGEVKLLLDENDVSQFQYLQNHFNLTDRGELVRFAITYLYGKVKSATFWSQQQVYPWHQQQPYPYYPTWTSAEGFPTQPPPPPNPNPPANFNFITDIMKLMMPKCWCGQDLSSPHPHNNL